MAEGEENLGTWLKRHKLSKYHKALANECGFEDVSDFRQCTKEEIKELASEIGMRFGERKRLENAIFDIPGSKLATPKAIIVDPEESKAMGDLKQMKTDAEDVLNKILKRMKDVEKSSKDSRRQMTVAFDNLITLIQRRKQVLDNAITLQLSKKTNNLKKQKKLVEQAIREISDLDEKCEDMITEMDFGENRKKLMKEKTSKGKQKLDTISKFELTTIMKFKTEKSPIVKAVGDFGSLMGTESTKPPKIVSVIAGIASVKVGWKPTTSYCEKFEVVLAQSDEKERDDIIFQKEFDANCLKTTIAVKSDTSYGVKIRSKSEIGWTSYSKLRAFRTKSPTPPFSDSILLTNTLHDVLPTYLRGEKIDAKLLFRASRDGFQIADFHDRCANKGPTLLVIKREGSDIIFGAYVPFNWQKPSSQHRGYGHGGGYGGGRGGGGYNSVVPPSWIPDNEMKMFLFTSNNGQGKCAKYSHTTNLGNGIYSDTARLHVMDGPGICITDNANTSRGCYTRPTYCTDAPSDESLCGIKRGVRFFGGPQRPTDGFNIVDYEVFSVKQ